MSKYITVLLKIRFRDSKGESMYVRRSFRKCTLEDFSNNGLKIKSSEMETELKNRLCPDIDGIPELYRVMNPYPE